MDIDALTTSIVLIERRTVEMPYAETSEDSRREMKQELMKAGWRVVGDDMRIGDVGRFAMQVFTIERPSV